MPVMPEPCFDVIAESGMSCMRCDQEEALVFERDGDEYREGICLRCVRVECEALLGMGWALISLRQGWTATRTTALEQGVFRYRWEPFTSRRGTTCQLCDRPTAICIRRPNRRLLYRLCDTCCLPMIARSVGLESARVRADAEVRATELEALAAANEAIYGLAAIHPEDTR